MNPNELLRLLRKVLAVNEEALSQIYSESGEQLPADDLRNHLRQPNEAGFIPCEEDTVARLIEAVILKKRGPKPGQKGIELSFPLTNNIVLKKMRIAFDLKDPDMHNIFSLSGVELSKQELSALFRREGHKNFQPCTDALLRAFLNGLNQRERKKPGDQTPAVS